MTQWKSPSDDDDIHYGLGIFKMETKFGDAYIHSGDAIGYAATMLYLPKDDIYISWAVNGNYGKIDALTQELEAMEHIIANVIK